MKIGYHLKDIPKGVLGEISKIVEEVAELQDAFDQRIKVLEICELSDIVGAINAFLEKHHPNISFEDLISMSKITERAFKNGHRK